MWLVEPARLDWMSLGRHVVASAVFAIGLLVVSVPFMRGIGFRSLLAEAGLPVVSGLARRLGGPRS
jgi:hypothetical protein